MSTMDRLEFPKTLVLHLVDGSTGPPASNVAVRLTLHARSKNDYHFAPSLSDSNGMINIERHWVTTSIEETRNFFLMDYQSTMEDCYPFVHVKVMSDEDLERAIAASQLYMGVKERMGVMLTSADLEKASNHGYEPQEIRLSLKDPAVEIKEVKIVLQPSGTQSSRK